MGSIPDDSHASTSTIPIVDFSNWHNATDRQKIANQLTSACRSVGFVYITNHGLHQALIDEAFAISKRLFALSHDEKMQAPHPPGPEVHRGYSYPGLEKVSQYLSTGAAEDKEMGEKLREVTDCKESYEIGSESNAAQPNVWLPESTLPGFKAFTTRFYWECYKVAMEILKAMALGIGLEDEEFFVKSHSGVNCQLRLLHYPSLPAADVEGGSVARMPAHSDWSTITMLFQDDCGGLEVEEPHQPGEFIPATPVPGACVVNVGDLLMRWSNDYLKSTLHRVGLPPLADRFEGEQRMTRPRYSIPFFVSADPHALVEVLPSCTDAQNPPKYEQITQLEYGRMRGAVQYRKS